MKITRNSAELFCLCFLNERMCYRTSIIVIESLQRANERCAYRTVQHYVSPKFFHFFSFKKKYHFNWRRTENMFWNNNKKINHAPAVVVISVSRNLDSSLTIILFLDKSMGTSSSVREHSSSLLNPPARINISTKLQTNRMHMYHSWRLSDFSLYFRGAIACTYGYVVYTVRVRKVDR